jgi:hypothetical protein
MKKLLTMIDSLEIQEDVLKARVTYNHKIVWAAIFPKELRPSVIVKCHTQHHSGIMRTYHRLRLSWYWPGMARDVKRTIKKCEVCQAAKAHHPAQTPRQQRLHAGRPWQVLSLDLVGPFPKTPRGNTIILVLADHFTKWKDANSSP